MKPIDSIEFFSIVLNGMPFVQYQYDIFKTLEVPWRWHIVEGAAELKKDTSWSLKTGGYLPECFHREGLSVDGTSTLLNSIGAADPERVFIYRRTNGSLWNGKVEMCRAFMTKIYANSIIWQIDIDEIWKKWQIEKMFEMFKDEPERTSACFKCNFFIGPRVAVQIDEPFSKNWLRVWRFEKGMEWISHEPPKLAKKGVLGYSNVGRLHPYTMEETEQKGLIYDHFAYVFPHQVKFKENYYGHKDLYKCWEKMLDWRDFPTSILNFFPNNGIDQKVEVRDAPFFNSEYFAVLNKEQNDTAET